MLKLNWKQTLTIVARVNTILIHLFYLFEVAGMKNLFSHSSNIQSGAKSAFLFQIFQFLPPTPHMPLQPLGAKSAPSPAGHVDENPKSSRALALKSLISPQNSLPSRFSHSHDPHCLSSGPSLPPPGLKSPLHQEPACSTRF